MFSIRPMHFALFDDECEDCGRGSCNRECGTDQTILDDFLRFLYGTQPKWHHQKRDKPQVWVQKLRLRGFLPNDINVKVEENKVHVHAKHQDGTGDNYDVYESHRALVIPDNVDKEKITSRLTTDSVLVLYAPLKVEEEKKQTYTREVKIQQDEKKAVENKREEGAGGEGGEQQMEVTEGAGEVVKKEEAGALAAPGQNEFNLDLDLGRFGSDNVKVLHKDDSIIVKAERTKEEDGVKMTEYYISTHSLPRDVDMESLKCLTGEDGKLTIRANKKGQKEEANEGEKPAE